MRGGHCTWSWEVATIFDGERRPPWLIMRGGHHFQLLSWSWEAATVLDRERRPPFLLTRLIERGGHHSWLWEAATVRFSNFLKIHYIKWHKIWFTLLYTFPYQPREVAASSDNFSGSGCMSWLRGQNFSLNLSTEEVWLNVEKFLPFDLTKKKITFGRIHVFWMYFKTEI